MTHCPLCSSPETISFHTDATREYLHCQSCDLVFAHPDGHLSSEEEFNRYELHQNDLKDPGYRAFLKKMSDPMLQRLHSNSRGLDFGSGPGPLLQLMFEEQGHNISLYDPFYAPDQTVFNDSYDFITATEVVEHLHNPIRDLDRLWGCLQPKGFLGIMTSLHNSEQDFMSWHYIKDPTHVIFFSKQTMTWLAKRWRAKLKIIGDSVVIFTKRPTQDEGGS